MTDLCSTVRICLIVDLTQCYFLVLAYFGCLYPSPGPPFDATPRPPGNALSAEAVEGLSLTLEGVDDVHGRDGLAASVLGVGDRVTDDVLEEDLEDTAGLLVDETGDALDAATTGETADGGLGDALDVIA